MISEKIFLILAIVFLILPVVNADIIIQKVDESSGIILNNSLDIELRNAIVKIDVNGGYLEAIFKIYSIQMKIRLITHKYI